MAEKATVAVSGNLSQHEINYTPSKWSKRFADEELLEYFLTFCDKTTVDAQKTIKCDLNVPYGTTNRSKYDVYGTDLPSDSPILVFIHGGYWQEFSKDLAGFAVPAFVKHGVKVLTVGYDLCPTVRIGEIISEIKSALEKILKTALTEGSKRIWIAGHSAGAHLAASILHDQSWIERMNKQGSFKLIKGIVLIGGVYQLDPIRSTSYNEALKLTDEEVEKFSFAKFDTSKYQPIQNLKVVVTVGESDSPIFVEESRNYAQKIISFVDDVQFILLRDNTDHFDIVEKLVKDEFALSKLLLSELLE